MNINITNRATSEFLDWLTVHGANVVFVPFGYGSTPERLFCDNDLIVAKELRENMKNANRLSVIDVEYKPEEILGVFRFFDMFIGMRFHSIIFSMMMGVPTIAIIYYTKTAELLKKEKTRNCFRISISDLNIDTLKIITSIAPKFLISS